MTDGLKFYPRSHRYKLDGQWVPGVTTLIKKGLPSPALIYWAAKTVAEWVADNDAALEQMRHMGRAPLVAALKEVPWEKRDQAAVRGTDVHALAEQVVNGDPVDIPEHLIGYVQGYVDWLDKTDLKPHSTERPVGSRMWRYAGTYDLIAELWGETWLLDVKTASGVYGNNALQLAAYAGAEFYVDADGVERPMPKIDRLGVLHVQDGETTLYPIVDRDNAWKDWLHVAHIGRREQQIKDYIGEPLAVDDHEGAMA